MATLRERAQARRIADRVARTLSEDGRRLREDAGLTRAALAAAAGLDRAFLGRVEDGEVRPSLETYARLARALGADLAAHLYPNTGPAIRDRHQARIVEALVSSLAPQWQPHLEVATRKPARGWIDLVLHHAAARLLVATEVQSSLARIEQLIRWSGEKAASLPSWDAYDGLGQIGGISRLLIVRSTRATRTIGREFVHQLEAAYPGHPADALAALRNGRAWPGPTLVWVDVRADGIRFIERRGPGAERRGPGVERRAGRRADV